VREYVAVEEGRRMKRVTNLNEELRKIPGSPGRQYDNYCS